jgi:hypothetical protein
VAAGAKRFSAKLSPPPGSGFELRPWEAPSPPRRERATWRPGDHGRRRPGGAGPILFARARVPPRFTSPRLIGLCPGPVRGETAAAGAGGVALARRKAATRPSLSLSSENLAGVGTWRVGRDATGTGGPRLRPASAGSGRARRAVRGHGGDRWRRAVGRRDLALISNGCSPAGHVRLSATRGRDETNRGHQGRSGKYALGTRRPNRRKAWGLGCTGAACRMPLNATMTGCSMRPQLQGRAFTSSGV